MTRITALFALAILASTVGCMTATHTDQRIVKTSGVDMDDTTISGDGHTTHRVVINTEAKTNKCLAQMNRGENGPGAFLDCTELEAQAIAVAKGAAGRGPMPLSSYGGGGYGPGWGGYPGGIAPPIQNGYAGTGVDPAQGYGAYPATMYANPGRPQGMDPDTARQIAKNAQALAKQQREIEALKRKGPIPPAAPKPEAPPPSQPADAP
jgi:hypothetical protein